MADNSSNRAVMILDPAGNLWGSERVLLDFLRSDPVQKSNIGLCCPPDTPLARIASKLGIIVYPFFKSNLHKKGKFARFLAMLGLARACYRHKANIIYINQAGATRIGLFVGRLLKIPVIPHVRLLEDVEYIENLAATSVAMPFVLVISKFIRDEFKVVASKKRVRILYDAYGINENSMQLQSDVSNTSICCAGRLVPIKGQDVLILAIAELARSNVNVSMDFYGAGLPGDNYEADLNGLVQRLGLASQVIFHGFTEDVPAEMRFHWAVICPSHIEPLGRVIFEAWDSGSLPVVGGFSGGAAEIIKASGGGILYDSQTPEALANVIQECINMPAQKRAEIVARGRHWLRENCDPEKYSRQLLKIFDDACT